MKNSIKLATPEKLVSINPQFVTALMVGCFILAFTLAYLFVTSSPKQITKAPEEVENKVSSDAMINAILQNDANEPLVTATPVSVSNTDIVHPVGEGHDFQAASESAISVYHKAAREPSFQQADSPQRFSAEATESETKLPNTYNDQNGQSEKSAFLRQQENAVTGVSSQRLQNALTPYQISAGTILPATLVTGINSDLPNQITARIRRPIYDSVTGNYMLIPQGTTIVGTYDSKVTYGQSRVLIAWSRLIFPNGTSLNIEGQPGVDLTGAAGLSDKVNRHTIRLFSSVVMMSLFGAAGQLSQPQNNGIAQTNAQVIYGAIGQQVSQAAAQLIAKQVNVQPTIMIRPGLNFNVLLTRDFVFPGPYRFAA